MPMRSMRLISVEPAILNFEQFEHFESKRMKLGELIQSKEMTEEALNALAKSGSVAAII